MTNNHRCCLPNAVTSTQRVSNHLRCSAAIGNPVAAFVREIKSQSSSTSDQSRQLNRLARDRNQNLDAATLEFYHESNDTPPWHLDTSQWSYCTS